MQITFPRNSYSLTTTFYTFSATTLNCNIVRTAPAFSLNEFFTTSFRKKSYMQVERKIATHNSSLKLSLYCKNLHSHIHTFSSKKQESPLIIRYTSVILHWWYLWSVAKSIDTSLCAIRESFPGSRAPLTEFFPSSKGLITSAVRRQNIFQNWTGNVSNNIAVDDSLHKIWLVYSVNISHIISCGNAVPKNAQTQCWSMRSCLFVFKKYIQDTTSALLFSIINDSLQVSY